MAAPTAHGRPARREVEEFHFREVGDDALRFAKWFMRSKFALMESFLGEVDRDRIYRDRTRLRARFLEAVRHAQKVLLARMVVTVLLAFSVVAATTSAFLDLVWLPATLAAGASALEGLLRTIAAVAGSLTLVLVVLRLAFDRYLGLVEVTATFVAMQLASARP